MTPFSVFVLKFIFKAWDWFCSELNGNCPIDFENSVYVGDAAGRDKGWKKKAKRDFGCSGNFFRILKILNFSLDRKFAQNVGLKFHTPDHFFNGKRS